MSSIQHYNIRPCYPISFGPTVHLVSKYLATFIILTHPSQKVRIYKLDSILYGCTHSQCWLIEISEESGTANEKPVLVSSDQSEAWKRFLDCRNQGPTGMYHVCQYKDLSSKLRRSPHICQVGVGSFIYTRQVCPQKLTESLLMRTYVKKKISYNYRLIYSTKTI